MAEAFRWETEESQKGQRVKTSQNRLLLLLATTNKYWFWASKMGEILGAFSVAA